MYHKLGKNAGRAIIPFVHSLLLLGLEKIAYSIEKPIDVALNVI